MRSLFIFILITLNASHLLGRIQIRICGSSTVYPFALKLSANFSNKTQYVSPVITCSGSTAGLKEFAKGIGDFTVDIANASRKIKDSEMDACKKAGIQYIGEMLIGFDGLALGISRKSEDMKNIKLSHLLLALAEKVPGEDGELIKNPYKLWSDIDSSYPKKPIRVLIPSLKHGTRDAFDELVMSSGSQKDVKIRKTKEVREISDYESADEHFLLFKLLEENPGTIAVFGYNLLEKHVKKVKALLINGVALTVDSVQHGKYPLARKLYFYVKCDNAPSVEGLQEYIDEWTSEDAVGKGGYLTQMGLIPCPPDTKQWCELF